MLTLEWTISINSVTTTCFNTPRSKNQSISMLNNSISIHWFIVWNKLQWRISSRFKQLKSAPIAFVCRFVFPESIQSQPGSTSLRGEVCTTKNILRKIYFCSRTVMFLLLHLQASGLSKQQEEKVNVLSNTIETNWKCDCKTKCFTIRTPQP